MNKKKKRNPSLKQVAYSAGVKLLLAGAAKRRWTPEERRNWDRAYSALARLSGRKELLYYARKRRSYRTGAMLNAMLPPKVFLYE